VIATVTERSRTWPCVRGREPTPSRAEGHALAFDRSSLNFTVAAPSQTTPQTDMCLLMNPSEAEIESAARPQTGAIELASLEDFDAVLAQIVSPLSPVWLSLAISKAQHLARSGHLKDAITWCEQALAHHPNSAELWSELASNYLEHGALQAAELGFRTALGLAPSHVELAFNLSVALQKQWKFDEALPLLLSVVQHHPDHHKAWSNLASAWGWQGRYAEQLEALNQALTLDAENASYHWNRSIVWLREGRFREGWAAYEARYVTLPKPPTPCTWHGEPMLEGTLWVACEQGLGDTLQFMRFLPWARARVGRLVLACPSALKPFLELQQCADEVIASDGTPPAGMPSIRLMSLPHLMQLQSPADLPTAPYLTAEPARLERMRERLGGSHRSGLPRVALSWQGSKKYGADSQRSMPLQHLLPLLRGWRAHFVSVQRGYGSEQIDTLPADVEIERLREEDDREGAFLDTAAILRSCDLFITTDSAVAHLAGGLGVRTVLLLPHAPDWRWGTPEQPLNWYDSVTPLFQQTPGDWDGLIAHLTESIQELNRAGAPKPTMQKTLES
jgi:tetratricopeptide (TPR) repeat protein